MSNRRTIEKNSNKSGVQFALVTDGVTFEVWKLCENYSRECKGGLKRAWRYVQKGMDETSARALFSRRIAGSAKV